MSRQKLYQYYVGIGNLFIKTPFYGVEDTDTQYTRPKVADTSNWAKAEGISPHDIFKEELTYSEIASIEHIEESETYDIWNYDLRCQDNEGGNFFIDDVLVHNSIPTAVANRDDINESWKGKLKDVHEIFYEVLQDTYGVIVWQEQLAAIWQRLGGFTAPEAQEARKAVAKKWTHKLKPIKSKWIEGASKNIGEENAKTYWSLMETFGRYAFNRCLYSDTKIKDQLTGSTKTIEEWYNSDTKPHVLAHDGEKVFVDECIDIHFTGELEVLEIQFDNGQIERVTANHKFLCDDGEYHEVREIIDKGLEVTEINVDKHNGKTKI